jgi:hypothetical protein
MDLDKYVEDSKADEVLILNKENMVKIQNSVPWQNQRRNSCMGEIMLKTE